MKGFVLVLLFSLFSLGSLHGQIEFCTGNTGDPIFTENFGTGLTNGPALAPGTTTYSYVNGAPSDGSYTISSFTQYYDWHNTADHTVGDTDGRSLIVNASFTAGEFYRREVSGLCENTTYQFAAWVLNLLPSPNSCPNGGIPINVRFEIWDITDTQLLRSGETGPIGAMTAPLWENYGLVFQTLPGQNEVILKLINNGQGGCGNDLAIDDISFRSCGDRLLLEDEANETSRIVCQEDGATTVQLEATPDFSVFNTHAYQWQESLDGINWTDIAGANQATYQSPPLLSDQFYRVKVAEDAVNLANDNCATVSDIYQIEVVPAPLPPSGNPLTEICEGEIGVLQAVVSAGERIDWYGQASGGNPLLSDNREFSPPAAGIYYAETVDVRSGCLSTTRTALELRFVPPPDVEDETLDFCQGTSAFLSAGYVGGTYQWSTGEMSPEILVREPGTYTVLVTNRAGCAETKTIVLEEIIIPRISLVKSDHREIQIEVAEAGDFEYSIDGFNFQNSPNFPDQVGGPYLLVVREKNGCGDSRLNYNHLVIPRFFTPNGDTQNQEFTIEGAAGLSQFRLRIYDRMGQLVFETGDPGIRWSGLREGRPLPSSDYWYVLQADDQVLRGHFTLKR